MAAGLTVLPAAAGSGFLHFVHPILQAEHLFPEGIDAELKVVKRAYAPFAELRDRGGYQMFGTCAALWCGGHLGPRL